MVCIIMDIFHEIDLSFMMPTEKKFTSRIYNISATMRHSVLILQICY